MDFITTSDAAPQKRKALKERGVIAALALLSLIVPIGSVKFMGVNQGFNVGSAAGFWAFFPIISAAVALVLPMANQKFDKVGIYADLATAVFSLILLAFTLYVISSGMSAMSNYQNLIGRGQAAGMMGFSPSFGVIVIAAFSAIASRRGYRILKEL